MRTTHARNIRVAAFMLIGLLVLGVVVVLIGQKSGMFESKVRLHVLFPDVGGLVVGAPVRLAGLDVGMVEEIEFAAGAERTEARVTLSVRERYLSRIRADSRAVIDSKGLLGDKLVEISVGSRDAAALHDGETLQAAAATSFGQLADSLDDAVGAITRAASATDEALTKLVTEDTRKDIGRILASLANIAEAVEHGDGLAHRLLYDKALADELHGVASEARQAIAASRQAVQRIDRILLAIEHGPGGAHELIYGTSASDAVADLAQTSQALRVLVQDIQTQDGLLHGLIYGQEQAQMLRDLAASAATLERMMRAIERGEGTIGGLIVDPTVYEDLKTILGNVERNVLLKALVRFAIKEGDIERPAKVPESEPSAEGAP